MLVETYEENKNQKGLAQAEFQALAKLQKLNLINLNISKTVLIEDTSRVSPKEIRWIAEAPWQGLQILSLNYNIIGDKGCKFLARGSWNMLQTLNLSTFLFIRLQLAGRNSLQMASERAMEISSSTQLLYGMANLGENKISWQGESYLVKCSWPALKQLTYGSKDVANIQKFQSIGLTYMLLLQAPNIKLFSYCTFCSNRIYEEEVKLFRACFFFRASKL